MNIEKLIQLHREAIAADRLKPPGAVFDEMVRDGLINEQGEVIFLDRLNAECGFTEPPPETPEPPPPPEPS